MKKFALIFLAFFVSQSLNSQQFVTSQKVFSKSTNYKFDNQWQYISSDLYLMNADKFNYLINHINPDKKKTKKNKDLITNILVTAQLDGLGELNKLVYPIFNFQVKKDDKGNMNAQVSETEVIRLVDNVPLSSVKDFIGAKVSIQAFTQSTKPEIYKFIANQLTVAATLSTLTATDAAMKLVGEIGKMMQNDAAGNQYQFESTIRFYEDTNFDRRFHSLTIFTFIPSYLKSANFDTNDIAKFIDTTQNVIIDKNKLKNVIKNRVFPYIVVVNYRTKYKTKLSEDVITETLNDREAQNEAFFRNNKISKEVYEQEKSLISFLRNYVQLQTDISSYEINYKTKITEDFTIQLFIILQDFWKLKNSHLLIEKTYRGNPLYDNEFSPYYQRYVNKANLLFETTSSLRNVKDIVETIFTLENKGISNMDSLQIEDNLRKLKSINIPQREIKSDEATTINRLINLLEAEQYQKNTLVLVNQLSSQPINKNTYYKVENLKMNVANSNCNICKDFVYQFANNFYIKYEQFLFNESTNQYNTLRTETKQNVMNNSMKITCIKTNLDSNIVNSSDAYWQLFLETLSNVEQKNNDLFKIINTSKNYTKSNEIDEQINLIKAKTKEIEADFLSLCQDRRANCNCNQSNSNTQAENNE